MKSKHKVPAFTLMEVTIAMLIAAIAIAVTYTAYRIVSGTYINYTKKQDHVATFSLADQLMKKDFLQADQILRTQDGLDMLSPGALISYQFKDSLMLREQHSLETDTFKLQVKAPRFSFENQDVAEGAAVDQFDFQTLLEGEVIPLSYKKTYSAQSLFK